MRNNRGGRGRGGRSRGGPVTANVAQQSANNTTDSVRTFNTSAGSPNFTNDQMQWLLNLLETASSSDKLFGKKIECKCLIDSGASHHMTGTLECLYNIYDIPQSPVSIPDGVQTAAISQGSVNLGNGLILQNVLYVPNLKCNLISVGQLILDSHCLVTFTEQLCIVQDHMSKTVIGLSELRNGVYVFRVMDQPIAAYATTLESVLLLHRRLGHPPSQHLSYVSSTSRSSKIKKELDSCDVCFRAK